MTVAPPRPTGISSAHAPDLDLPARFMALGMAALVLVALVFPFALPLLARGFAAPRVLAFVHLNTLGVIAAVIMGASYQLVPVVLQTPLASVALGRVTFWLHLTGLVLFFPGLWFAWTPGVGASATLLFSGLLLYLGVIAVTIARAPRRDVVAWHIAVSLAGLAGGVTLGLLLALNEGAGFLGGLTLRLMAGHATLMLGGWVAVLLGGVSYRLAGMFTLAEDRLSQPVAWLELALTALGAWGVALALVLSAPRPLLLLASLALLAGQALFAGQLAHLYHVRRRRGPDVHIPFALVAAAAGVAAAALLAGGLAAGTGPGARLWPLVVWLALVGLAETAIQGFFYKIATFLVWLRRYAPQAGKRRVPKLEELYGQQLARAGWACWTLGLPLAAAGLLSASPLVCRLAGLAAGLGLAAFLINVARIAAHWRAPSGITHQRALGSSRAGAPEKGPLS
ncbi:MAG TPA: hypothetical protein VFI42_14080 [Thermomicrobiaceae bacterium]|nr:hypothetical protein [Thermomicrobiaceae bacterium]